MEVTVRQFHRKRLLKLAEFLETLPPKDFDISWWRAECEGSDGKCGTTYCAVGWATTFPENRRAGLTLSSAKSDYTPKFKPVSEQDKRYCKAADREDGAVWKRAGTYLGGTAAERFFGLTEKQAEGLFYWLPGGKHPTARQVAKQIRRVVEKATAAEAK